MNFDPTITIGALGLLATVAGLGLSVLVALRSMRRQNEADTRAGTDEIKEQLRQRHEENRDLINELKVGLGERVSKLEGATGGFVPRAEIETKFEHEKGNRVAQGDAALRRFERLDGEITDLKVRVGGLSQRQDGHDQQMAELKALVREGFDKQGEKLDRLADTVRGGKA